MALIHPVHRIPETPTSGRSGRHRHWNTTCFPPPEPGQDSPIPLDSRLMQEVRQELLRFWHRSETNCDGGRYTLGPPRTRNRWTGLSNAETRTKMQDPVAETPFLQDRSGEESAKFVEIGEHSSFVQERRYVRD
jgi:hypothetical protein